MSGLPDGRYDAFVVDATEHDGEPQTITLDLTIVTGAHKGEMVTLTASGLARSEIDLIGMPATLAVADGRPTVTIDD